MIILNDYTLNDMFGNTIEWSSFNDKPVLFCNIARFCGLSPQLNELERLKELNPDLQIILSPCNQFFQEPGSKDNICKFYQTTKLIITEKLKVNGPNAHPLYKALKSHTRSHPLRSVIFWNFTKFLLPAHREFARRYGPLTSPLLIKL